MSEVSILVIVLCTVFLNYSAWKMFSITEFRSAFTERLSLVGTILFCTILIWCLTFIR